MSDPQKQHITLPLLKPGKILTITSELFWYVYLVLVVVISFANTPASSRLWVTITASVFLYFGLYLGFCGCLSKPRLKALYAARYALLLLIFMLLWLVLQQVIGSNSYLADHLFSQTNRPDWFHYDGAWSTTPQKTWWLMLSNITVYLIFVLTLLLLDTRKRVKQLIWVLLIVGLVHALIALFAKYTGIYFVDKVSLDGHFEAARGMFVNRNHLAAFIILCLSSPIALQVKLLINNTRKNILEFTFIQFVSWSFLFFLIGLVCVFIAESRAAILSLLGCIMIYVVVLFRRAEVVCSSSKQHYFIFALIGLSVLVSLFIGQGMVDRFLNNGLSIGERSTQWAITWEAIRHEFLFGYGAGSYELVFQTFRSYADLRTVIYDQAHNDYLHIFLEQGFIGLVLWLSFILCSLVYAVRHYLKAQSTLICAVLFGGLVVVSAILLQSLVDYPLQIMTIRCYFFVIIALLYAVPTVRHR